MQEKKVGKVIKGLSNEIGRFIQPYINEEAEQLTMSQFHFITYILEESQIGPVYQKDLEANFNIRRSTATGILQRLEKNQLVKRQATATDGRLKSLSLTPQGYDAYQSRRQKLDNANRLFVSGIDPEELATFYRVIDQIHSNLATAKKSVTKEKNL